MKPKRLLINVLLVTGVSLTSCATYSSSDPNDVYEYLHTYGTDTSNWEGIKLDGNYKINYDSPSFAYDYDIDFSLKASNYNGEYGALFTLGGTAKEVDYKYDETYKSKGDYKMFMNDEGIYLDLKVTDDEGAEEEYFTFPFSIGLDTLILFGVFPVSEVDELLLGCIYESGYADTYDSFKLTASIRESGSGAKAKFKMKYSYTHGMYNSSTTYDETESYDVTVNYDNDHYLDSYSMNMEYDEKRSDGYYDHEYFKISASSYNKKISTPSWAK